MFVVSIPRLPAIGERLYASQGSVKLLLCFGLEIRWFWQ
jgi:hypothetical protein